MKCTFIGDGSFFKHIWVYGIVGLALIKTFMLDVGQSFIIREKYY